MSSPYTFDPKQSPEYMGTLTSNRTVYGPLDEVTLTINRKEAKSCRMFVLPVSERQKIEVQAADR